MTDPQDTRDTGPALWRMIDFKIPLIWLLGGFAAMAYGGISMHFQLAEVSRRMIDLQITVNAGNTQNVTLAGEIALVKFRLEHLESEADRRRKP